MHGRARRHRRLRRHRRHRRRRSSPGLADKAVGESRERVRAALFAIGLALPPKRITMNLAPVDRLKGGGHYDLPIALGLLPAMGVLAADARAPPARCA
jgi:predicted ATPase with chaperone activity